MTTRYTVIPSAEQYFKIADYRYENALLHNAHPDKVAVLAYERAMSLSRHRAVKANLRAAFAAAYERALSNPTKPMKRKSSL